MYNSLPSFFISSKVVNMFNTGMCAPLREICSSNVTKKIILNLSRSHVRYGRHFPFFIMMFCDCFYCLILCSLAFFCLISSSFAFFIVFTWWQRIATMWQFYHIFALDMILILSPSIDFIFRTVDIPNMSQCLIQEPTPPPRESQCRCKTNIKHDVAFDIKNSAGLWYKK